MTRILVALALVVSSTSTVYADSTEEARRYFDGGRQAYESGRFAAAISSFETAYKLSPRPSIVFALAQAYRRQHSIDDDLAKLLEADRLYKQYLAEVPQGERREEATKYLGEIKLLVLAAQSRKTPAPVVAAKPVATELMVSSQTKDAKGSIDGGALSAMPVVAEVKPGVHKVHVEAAGYITAEMDATAVDGKFIVSEVTLVEKPAQLEVKAPAGSSISVDGRPVATAPLPRPLSLAAGKHFVTVSRRGHAGWSRELTLDRGDTKSVDAALQKTTQRRMSYWVFGGAGGLAVIGGVTTVLGFVARSSAKDLETKFAAGTGTPDDLDEHNRLAARSGRFATASKVLFGGAAVVAVTGALLYYLDSPRLEAQGAVVPTLTPGGGVGASWMRSF